MTLLHDRTRTLPAAEGARGQALVEFSLSVIPFLFLLMGVVDLGRAIYQMNATAEAAREIAREASVLGVDASSVDDVIAVQRNLVPMIQFTKATDVTCLTVDDQPSTLCRPGEFVQVRVASTFTPATVPLLLLFGSHVLESVTTMEIEQ